MDENENKDSEHENITNENLTDKQKISNEIMINQEPEISDKNTDKEKVKTNFFPLLIFGIILFISFYFLGNIAFENNDININRVVDKKFTNVNIKEIKPGEIMNAKQIYKNNVNSVVGIQTQINENIFGQTVNSAASGTGFIISENGYIVTNYHVIENASEIKVNLYDEKSHIATLIGTEEELDIAVIKIDSEDLMPVVIGDSSNIIVGEDVYTIGHPLGQLTYTLTDGIISAKDRMIALDTYLNLNMFQTNTVMNTGNSGGPIFNEYGDVIGIATAKYASNDIEGIGFGIPINDVLDSIKQIIEYGRVIDKAYLGVTVTSVSKDDFEKNKMPYGAYIEEITKGTCADKAGLKKGDIIVKVDNYDILTNSDLISIKKKFKAGNTAIFKVWRAETYFEIKITFDTYDKIAEYSVKKFQEDQLKKIEEQYKQYQKTLP